LIISAPEALQRLQDGNQRYISGKSENIRFDEDSRRKLAGGQDPYAVILGCSDSRVPAELVFDQGLGDLFVIRVAGNIIAPSLIGSVEFAASMFGVRLVVVLGHTSCGAIEATIKELKQPDTIVSPNLAAIVNRVSPAVKSLMETELVNDHEQLVKTAIRANIRASMAQLNAGSAILQDLTQTDGLQIVGAEYNLSSGAVEFLN